jgi:hypothetical protein
MGRQVETGPGTVLSASAGKDGAVMQVSEGTATITGDGQRREIASGTMVALDAKGAEQTVQETARPDTPPEQPVTEPQAPPEPPQPPILPPLAAPLNLQPPTGHRIGIAQLKESNSIVFTWSAVQGADAYIFTLYKDTDDGRRQIIRVPPGNRRDRTLENIETLGEGTFFWQVEAVNVSSGVERSGRIAENSFVIDVPRSGIVQINEE